MRHTLGIHKVPGSNCVKRGHKLVTLTDAYRSVSFCIKMSYGFNRRRGTRFSKMARGGNGRFGGPVQGCLSDSIAEGFFAKDKAHISTTARLFP